MASGYQLGDIVPWRFDAGIVVASFFASLSGTVLCVELLHRKRLGKTLISRVQLLLCAVAMGLIGIWCMHFIGNRSIILGDGSASLQLEYSPGFTFLSCVLPVIGLTLAFYIAELRIKSSAVRRFLDVLTGFIAGASIVGMHYCGNVGTLNYSLSYPSRFIAAASIIAVGDCIIALMLFFYFKEKWINVFWKRCCCAVLLSIAVCGMHYTATVGCTYRLISYSTAASTRDVPFIVAGALCAASLICTIIILVWTSKRSKDLASKAQQVNLACAYFDDEGNIMVSTEGFLPSQKIAKRFSMQSFDDEFSTGHPVFHWLWKVSHDWQSVQELIPKMRAHLRRHDPLSRHASRPTTSGSTASSASSTDAESGNETILFREGFVVAAADLADRLNIKVDQLGNLFDRVTGTGIIAPNSKAARTMSQSDAASFASSSHLEKGQLLFFTRKLTKDHVEEFLARGYRFAPPNRVEAMIARTMQLPIASVAGHIKTLNEYASSANAASIIKQGTYLTCFAALGRLSRHFDILVSTNHRDQLPDMQLAPQHLNQTQLNFLKQYDGWSAGRMVTDLKQKRSREQHVKADERGFILLLINSLSSLSHQISEEWFNDLVFNAKPIVTYYGRGPGASQAMVFGLTKLLDIHQSIVQKPDRLAFVPLDFYRIRAAFYPGSAEIAKFRAQTHTEFGTVFTRGQHETYEKSPRIGVHVMGMGGKMRKLSMAHKTGHDDMYKEDSISERGLVEVESDGGKTSFDHIQPTSHKKGIWGGILATTDTVIVESAAKTGSTLEMKSFAPRVTATVVMDDRDDSLTFADLLYQQAKYRGVSRVADTKPAN